MLRTLMTGAAIATTILALAACQNEKAASPTTAPTSQPSMGMLNSTCPISGEPVSGEAKTADYNGHKIGFCCNMCVGKWEAMSDAEKKADVATYTK